MTDWEVWRTDADGARTHVASFPDRIEALAQILIVGAEPAYELVGGGPVVRTNRDLYLRLIRLGQDLSASGRALLDYLCAVWAVSRPLARYEQIDPDLLAALLTAAATAHPARPEPAWRVADFTVEGDYMNYADFTKVLCTQISDLLAFEEAPPGPYASLGVAAPPRLDGGRATLDTWCNFDPASFLECAAAGAFGGFSAADGTRVMVTGDPPADNVVPLSPLTWGDVGAFLEYGQTYE